MLSLAKGPIQRLGVRCISSVVPKSDIAVTDFTVKNEPVLGYMPGSQERSDLEAALKRHQDVTEDIPIIIGGKEYRTDDVRYQVMPHDHAKRWQNSTMPPQSWWAKPLKRLCKPKRSGKKCLWIKDSSCS